MDFERVQRSGERLGVFASPEFDFQFVRMLAGMPYGAATIGECLTTARAIKDGDTDSWVTAWSQTAGRVERLAGDARRHGDTVTARDGFRRAASYWRIAEFFAGIDDPRLDTCWRKSNDACAASATLEPFVFEQRRFPYDGRHLPGFIMRPGGDGPFPVLVLLSGSDGNNTDNYLWHGIEAVTRGYCAVGFQGPGQTDDWHLARSTFRPDYEAPISAVLDTIVQLPFVDPARVALLGESWGGYFALRGAAADDRIRACIANSPVHDLYAYMLGSYPPEIVGLVLSPPPVDDIVALERSAPPGSFQRWGAELFASKFGTRTWVESVQALRGYTMEGRLGYIRCPVLGLVCEGEGPGAVSQARHVTDTVPGPATLMVIQADQGATAHCLLDNLPLANHLIFSWLDRQFRDKPRSS